MLTIKAERIIYIIYILYIPTCSGRNCFFLIYYIYIYINDICYRKSRTCREENLKSLIILLLLHNHYFIVPSFRMYIYE